MEKQAEYRKARAIIVTCIDNQGVEGQLSVGAHYKAQGVYRCDSYLYYTLRNDFGDLVNYGAHRFDTRPCNDLQLKNS